MDGHEGYFSIKPDFFETHPGHGREAAKDDHPHAQIKSQGGQGAEYLL